MKIYTANWRIPRYGIGYVPKDFAFTSTNLLDSGTQNIPIQKTKPFHVGAIDQLMLENSWTLQAQLV